MRRRKFINTLGMGTGSLLIGNWIEELPLPAMPSIPLNSTPEDVASDERYWQLIQQQYITSKEKINLNNGGVSPQPISVLKAHYNFYKEANQVPSLYLFRRMKDDREQVRVRLSGMLGCTAEEIAILRNTTEALETVLFGYPLEAGDEILATDQDYPSMLNTLAQRQRRNGIIIKKIALPTGDYSTKAVLAAFEKAITSKTKLILVSHVINLSGFIMPVKAICDLAHERGIEVVCDGAHSFAQLDFQIADLGCDYYGTSLHKWLNAPYGTGILYIKKEKIPKVWPLFGYPEEEAGIITKFEHRGTLNTPAELAIEEAIDFHQQIGTANKQARLLYLRDYWVKQVTSIPGFVLHSPMAKDISTVLCTFSLQSLPVGEMFNALERDYSIHCTVTGHPQVDGVRITPNIYTTLQDLDSLSSAIAEMAQS